MDKLKPTGECHNICGQNRGDDHYPVVASHEVFEEINAHQASNQS